MTQNNFIKDYPVGRKAPNSFIKKASGEISQGFYFLPQNISF